MFGKLVKHEFRATARIIPFIFLVTVVLAGVHVVTSIFNLGTISKISLVLTVLMCFAQVAIAFVLVIWRYYRSMYSNEGYLTHTLPVPPSELLWSKLLVGFAWSLASYVVAGAVGFGLLAKSFLKTEEDWKSMEAGYKAILSLMGLAGHEALLWSVFAALILISIVIVLAEAYFAISIGSMSKMHSLGIGGPILVFIAEYIVLQIINTLAVLFIPLGLEMSVSGEKMTEIRLVTKNMISSLAGNYFNNTSVDTGVIGIGSYILLPFILAGLLFLTAHVVSRRTSLK